MSIKRRQKECLLSFTQRKNPRCIRQVFRLSFILLFRLPMKSHSGQWKFVCITVAGAARESPVPILSINTPERKIIISHYIEKVQGLSLNLNALIQFLSLYKPVDHLQNGCNGPGKREGNINAGKCLLNWKDGPNPNQTYTADAKNT